MELKSAKALINYSLVKYKPHDGNQDPWGGGGRLKK